MIFSVSSVFITIIISLLMIVLFCLILSNKKLIFFLRSDLLIVLSFIIVLRLLIPIEWLFTVTIPFPWIMNPLQSFLNAEIIGNITVLSLILTLWIIGGSVQIIRLIIQLKKISKIYHVLELTSKKKTVSDYFEVDEKMNYPIWINQSIPFPMILGFRKVILFPDLDLEQSEIELIILHEMEHLKHHDNGIKFFLSILLIIYWWFPPVYWLCNRIQLVLEMRVDKSVTKEFSDLRVTEYMEILIKVQKALSSKANVTFRKLGVSSTFYINDGSGTLHYRINYLLNRHYKKSTNTLLIGVIILLPLLSNYIVLEPFYEAPLDKDKDEFILPSEAGDDFIIQHKDGTYTIYFVGEVYHTEEIDPIFEYLPIIKE